MELLYRNNPKQFLRDFPAAFAQRSDSVVLQAWRERLFYEEAERALPPVAAAQWRPFDVWLTILLSLIAGTLAKLPDILSLSNPERFYERGLAAIVIGAMMVYFMIQRCRRWKVASLLFALLLGSVLFLNLLPAQARSQSIELACMHMPLFLWTLLGIAYLGGAWRDMEGRVRFLRYNGELLIYTTALLLGGGVLSGLTLGLFSLIDVNIEKWYFAHVVIYGAVAAPLVATMLVDRVVGNRLKIAPLLAKVFTPLFLITVVAYLIGMIVNQRSPFTDREFLIAFNALLLLVLGLCIFSISERGAQPSTSAVDIMNIGLVVVTLLIDAIALAAIVFRLTSYGLTPNRIAVLGANLLAFCHLAGIAWHYLRFAMRKAGRERIQHWIVAYLPAYSLWSVVIAVGFPLIFRFR